MDKIVNLAYVGTESLVQELQGREGVKTTIAAPYEDVSVQANGPAIVIVVTD